MLTHEWRKLHKGLCEKTNSVLVKGIEERCDENDKIVLHLWQMLLALLLWNVQMIVNRDNIPNQLRFVLPISSHVIMPMGSFAIMLLFAFMAHIHGMKYVGEIKRCLSRD